MTMTRFEEGVLSLAPSLAAGGRLSISIATPGEAHGGALGVPVATDTAPPARLGLTRAQLEAAGFDGSVGSVLPIPGGAGPLMVAFGIGPAAAQDAAALRAGAAAFARAAAVQQALTISVEGLQTRDPAAVAQALVEGALLARYSFEALRREKRGAPVASLALDWTDAPPEAAAGAEAGRIAAQAQMLARDLCNTPHSHLTAAMLADFAVALGAAKGFDVEVFDETRLAEMGCGGILGVSRGSAEPPRVIRLDWRPAGVSRRIALVGKGLMYDSGGISLKPSDPVHAQMKNDMAGAAAILAAVAAIAERETPVAVTAFLMCTDNMPSGTAIGLGDVLHIRGGTTVEVMDTDAEGRLILADGLVLAAEEKPDAILDVATLTGSVARALGPDVAGLLGNDEVLIARVRAAGEAVSEPVWPLPLHAPYRRMLASDTADIKNCAPVGRPDGILAALFLERFVDDTPWAHIDIAGVAWSEETEGVHVSGCAGFGARLLLSFLETEGGVA
jgi:leucyl aminopeptidase